MKSNVFFSVWTNMSDIEKFMVQEPKGIKINGKRLNILNRGL